MKNVKSLVLKGMLASMMAMTCLGTLVPMMTNTKVLAAETENSTLVESYENITEAQGYEYLASAKNSGTVLSEVDNKTSVDLNGVTYTYTMYRTHTEEQLATCNTDNWTAFYTERSAYQFAASHGWKNIQVYKTPGFLPAFVTYYVKGDLQYVNLEVTQNMNAAVETVNMNCDEYTMEAGQSTFLHVTVNEGADVNQVVVESCNPEVATVENCGNGTFVVYGNAFGSALLKAHTTDNLTILNTTSVDVFNQK